MKFLFFTLSLFASLSFRAEAQTASPLLLNEINLALKDASYLHKALVTQSEEQIEITSRQLIMQIERVKAFSITVKAHERRHLLRILSAVREHMDLSMASFGDDRRDRFEDAFSQLTNLIRLYNVDRRFVIFFCPKDRTSWVQQGNKPENPFRPDSLRSCGVRVTR